MKAIQETKLNIEKINYSVFSLMKKLTLSII